MYQILHPEWFNELVWVEKLFVTIRVAGSMYKAKLVANEGQAHGFQGSCFVDIFKRFSVKKGWIMVFEHYPVSAVFKLKMFDTAGKSVTKDHGNLTIIGIYFISTYILMFN